jgi:hypothetical protein
MQIGGFMALVFVKARVQKIEAFRRDVHNLKAEIAAI